ncbi:MAG: hypothetical protein U0031_07435 [Thermomicrobiales bacterium]
MGPAAWSPDGSLLAAAAYAEKRGAPNGVFVIDPAKGTATKVSDLSPDSTLTWNAKGDSVLFAATRNGRSDVYQVPISGEESEALTGSQPAGARNPAYSAESDRLAFESDGQILVIDLVTRDREIARFGPVSGGFPLSWNPEGDQIAFVSAPNQIISYP